MTMAGGWDLEQAVLDASAVMAVVRRAPFFVIR